MDERDSAGADRHEVGGVWPLPVAGPPVPALDAALLDRFRNIGAATACAKLHQMGVTKTFVAGPRAHHEGLHSVGRAVTLQFMPMREDVYQDSGVTQEYMERATALWAVLDAIEPGDFLVVEARGTIRSGVVGEMLAKHLLNRGGVGLVADGGVRDWAKVRSTGVPMWSLGPTPHYASQGELIPWAYHTPVAVGGVLVIPGDLVVGDDDGVVIVPAARAHRVAELSEHHESWEEFSRLQLERGGALRKYYPLSDEGRREYEEWAANGRPVETKSL